MVVGKLGSCGKNKLVVSAHKEVHVELTDTPTIYVALTDPKLMAVGAKVKIHGKATESPRGSFCVPDMVTVVLPERLTGKEKPSQLAPPEKSAIPKEATEADAGSGRRCGYSQNAG